MKPNREQFYEKTNELLDALPEEYKGICLIGYVPGYLDRASLQGVFTVAQLRLITDRLEEWNRLTLQSTASASSE